MLINDTILEKNLDNGLSNHIFYKWKELEDNFLISCWIHLLLCFLSIFLFSILWGIFILLSTFWIVCSSLNEPIIFLGLGSLVCLSIPTHLIYESYDVWRTYPYWRNIERYERTRYFVALPICLSYVVLILGMNEHTTSFDHLMTLFVFLGSLEFGIGFFSAQFAERKIRVFRTFLVQMETVEDSDPHITDEDLSDVSDNLPTINNYLLGDRSSFSVSNLDECTNMLLEASEHLISEQKKFLCADGSERVVGSISFNLVSDKEVQYFNIPFCPPFGSIPECEVEQVSGETIQFSHTVQTYGIRLEVRNIEKKDFYEEIIIGYNVFSSENRENSIM